MNGRTLQRRILWGTLGLLVAIGSFQPAGYSMGWLEKKFSGEEFFEKLRRAKPLIKQQADEALRHLGYDPSQLTSSVSPLGKDEAIWTVKYWYTPPEDYYMAVSRNGDLEVHLNSRGKVKRVVSYEDSKERLLYGKDERILDGMSPEQVRERLGSPDYEGSPPRYIKRAIADTMWRYNRNTNRTMRTHVYFKNGKVVSVSYFGK